MHHAAPGRREFFLGKINMPGILYLIPNSLGVAPGPNPLASLIPDQVQAITARLDCFIAENAKTARAHLKQVAQTHPLARPLQEITILELDVNTTAAALPALLTPLETG